MPIDLPIAAIRDQLHLRLRDSNRFILSAPAGSGKSTRVPQYLLDDLGNRIRGEIWVLQPRRLPARMLAARVARERSEKIGHTVGYRVRFDSKHSPATRIVYVTEALLLRHLRQSPDLKGIGAVLFDEFHERHLDGDLALSLCKQVQNRDRPDLIIGVMSATLELDAAKSFLPDAVFLQTDARAFPVDIHYAPCGERPVWEAAAQALRKALANGIDGDCLIFMPGAWEIRQTIDCISHLRETREMEVFPLHGELPPEAQDAAVSRGDRPRVIVATNVAETSLTIEGVRMVIDSGLARIPWYDPQRGINTLWVQPISRASADQRAGRAGRVAPGRCFRLWNEKEHWRRLEHTPPEVTRLELSPALLTLADWGIRNFTTFPWLEHPPADHFERAISLLVDLDAIHALAADPLEFEITAKGRKMASFPLHPRYACILLAAADHQCLEVMCLAVALCQGRDIVLPPGDRRKAEARDDFLLDDDARQSDIIHAMRAWHWARRENFAMGFCREWGIHRNAAIEAGRVAAQLLQDAKSAGLDATADEVDAETIRRCLLQGFADHLAVRRNRSTLICDILHGRRGEIRRHSVVHDAELLISAEIEERNVRGDVQIMLGQNTAVEREWLRLDFPDAYSESVDTVLESGSRRIVQKRLVRFRDLILEQTETGTPDPDASARILAQGVADGLFILKNWNESVENWIRRVNCLAHWFPEFEIELLRTSDRQFLIEQICYGAISYKEIKDRPVMPVLRDWLTPEQLPLLDSHVPERFPLPDGPKVKLRYEEDGSVVLPAVLQQLYDVSGASLQIGAGRIPLKIEILAPSRRPVQITSDLDAFWTTSYPAIRKDLKGRYPKHEWR